MWKYQRYMWNWRCLWKKSWHFIYHMKGYTVSNLNRCIILLSCIQMYFNYTYCPLSWCRWSNDANSWGPAKHLYCYISFGKVCQQCWFYGNPRQTWGHSMLHYDLFIPEPPHATRQPLCHWVGHTEVSQVDSPVLCVTSAA